MRKQLKVSRGIGIKTQRRGINLDRPQDNGPSMSVVACRKYTSPRHKDMEMKNYRKIQSIGGNRHKQKQGSNWEAKMHMVTLGFHNRCEQHIKHVYCRPMCQRGKRFEDNPFSGRTRFF